jgi:hypothetical protein
MMAHVLNQGRLFGLTPLDWALLLGRPDVVRGTNVAFLISGWAWINRSGPLHANLVSRKRHAERQSLDWRVVATKKNPITERLGVLKVVAST